MVVGLAMEAVAWRMVASRRRNVWIVMTPALVVMGLAALAIGPPAWSPLVDPVTAVGVGLLAGAALYVATRGFAAMVRRWSAFQRQSSSMYLRREPLSVAGALLLSVGLLVPGEELFWRGLFQVELVEALGDRAALAAVLSWGAFVAANLPSANLAIVAGASVGGAVWTALGWWTGGALAPLASHAVWTALMLSVPVVPVRKGVAS